MTSTPRTQTYTIEEITLEALQSEPILVVFLRHVTTHGFFSIAPEYNPDDFSFMDYLRDPNTRVMLCKRGELNVGIMCMRLTTSIFAPKMIVLQQDLLYTKRGTRAAKLLMDDFIDFGKRNANHIMTTIADTTNIKPRSLEKLGFKKLEVLYRMETR